MRGFTVGALLLLLASVPPHDALAQYPGEMRPQSQSDAIANQQHGFKVWAPDEKVREIQQALQDNQGAFGRLALCQGPFQDGEGYAPAGELCPLRGHKGLIGERASGVDHRPNRREGPVNVAILAL